MRGISVIFIILLISLQANAYPNKRTQISTINQLNDGNYSDLTIFNSLYLQCHSSSEALQLMLELDKLIKHPSCVPLNHIAAASSISFLGNHTLAIQQLEELSSTLSSQTNYIRGEYYVALGKISYRSENPKSAIRHIKIGINYLDETTEFEALQVAYTNLGLAYGAINKHEIALKYYNQATRISGNSSSKTQLYLQLNRALSLTSLGEHDQSKEAFKNALTIIAETNDYFAEVRTYGNLADIYIIEDSLELAEDYLQKGKKLASEQGFKLDLIRFNLSLAQLSKSQGEFEKAFFYLQEHDSIRNSVHIEKASEEIVKLEKLNQEAINQLEQKALRETIQLKKQKNWILWGGLTLLSLLCTFLLRQFIVIRRKNKVLLKKNIADGYSELSQSETNKSITITDETLSLIRSFEEYLINKRSFCKVDLTQEKVAKKLGTNRTYLSKAINNYYNVSYSRWINELRISESKKMLTDKNFQHFSIEGIATSVGFSSLSAFNSNFKSITGLTPSYFRKNHPKL